MSNLRRIIESFATHRVLVVGDIMLDEYLQGSIDRISPEAPVPILSANNHHDKPGGAANVALNLKALGAQVSLIGLIGQDLAGGRLKKAISDQGISTDFLVDSTTRRTTAKLRVMAKSQHVLRIDTEDTVTCSIAEQTAILTALEQVIELKKPALVILQDYDKGVFNEEVISRAIALCKRHHIKVSVDPKFKNFWSFKHVDLFKPNLKEVTEALGVDGPSDTSVSELNRISAILSRKLVSDRTLITLGAEGAFLSSNQETLRAQTNEIEIVDVCGAGDSVIAATSLAVASNASDSELLALANLAGGVACQQLGVQPVSKEDLLKLL